MMLSIAGRSSSRRIFRTGFRKARQDVRCLSIHEYQAQDMLNKAGVRVPNGELARTPEDVERISKALGSTCVLKSQILSGGRAKGTFDSGLVGGIQVVSNPTDARKISTQMLGHRLRTKQTGDQGLTVERLYVVEKLQYKSEYYLAVTMDRESYSPAIVVSKAGGINIEDAAHNDPDAILKLPLKYDEGVTDEAIDRVAEALNLGVKPAAQLGDVLKRLYTLFVERDATLLEINPFVRTADGEFICLDSKFTFDDAAAPRQSELFALQAKDTTSQDEQEASKHGLVYVRLDGDIGNVVNGAGLAMATNDAISYYGGRSANFLDAGGQATTETMVKAFEIVLNDERVKVILVNIYGGIIRCDMVAESVIQAAAQLGPLRCPIVVRLQGTNSKDGQRMIRESGLNLISEADFGRAAQVAVEKASEL